MDNRFGRGNRRQHPRVPVNLPLVWRRQHLEREDEPRSGRAVDISEGGLRLELEAGDVLNLGDVITVELAAEPVPVQRRGLVVSTNPGVHVAFKQLPDSDESLLSLLGLPPS